MKPHVRVLTEKRDRLLIEFNCVLGEVEASKGELTFASARAEKIKADLDDIEAFLRRQPP